VFTPLLAESACGTIELRTTVEPVRGKRMKAKYIQAWADGVDFTQKSITVEDAVLDPKQGMEVLKPRRYLISTNKH
jgi:NADH dehydrogenase FAD-containing subunit